MGTTLEGKQINQTYQGLLKTTDNNEVGVDAKEITDGKGNGTGVTLDNSGNVVANGSVTANAFVGDGSQLTNVPYPVTSVNTQTGDVVLDTDDIAEGSNQYYTDAKVEANSAVAANTLKVGITAQQTSDILTNNSKVGITTEQASEIAANTLKVGITTAQANEIAANTLKTGITQSQADAITANTLKNTYPTDDASKLSGIEAGAEVNTVDSVNSLTGAVSLGLLDLDDVGADGNPGEVLTTNGAGSFTFAPAGGGTGTVTSVNGATGAVVLDADDISDTDTTNKFTSASDITKLSGIESGAEVNPTSTDELTEGTTNLYYTEARTDARVDAQTGANLDLSQRTTSDLNEGTNLYYTEARVSANTAVAANTAKVGITAQQATDITTNNAKVGITTDQANAIVANTAKNSYPSADSTKVGHISVTQAVDLDTLESDVSTNNAKVGITTQQADEIAANTLKTGITAQQASDITANNAKVSMVLGTTAGTALEGNTPLLQLGTTSTTALAGDTTTITAQQAADIVTNNAKVGITTQQASDITANNAKISFDSASSTKLAGIEALAQVNPTASEIKTSYESNNNTNAYTDAEKTKLSGIAENAEVNVNADWNATEGDAQILNKPTLATVATSGSYNDLSNTPTIPTNNNELTNGAGYITDGNTGWDNTYGFITASTTDTLTNKSGSNNQWTNDAGYINEAAQTAQTNAIGNAIDFSARVTLDGGVAEGTSGIIKNLQSIS